MKTTADKRPKNQVLLRIEIEPSEYHRDVQAAATRLSSNSAFPGFRPGKVPYDLVAQRFGEQAILEEAIEDIVRRTYTAAVREQKLTTIGQPKISMEKIAPGNPIVYTAVVALLPSVSLPPLESVNVEHHHRPVTDEDVAKSVEDLRQMAAKVTPVERAAKLGDRVELDFDVFVDHVPIEGGTSRNHPVILGEGNFVPGFEDRVAGMAKEQTKEFSLTFPNNYHVKHMAGKTADFKVKVNAVAERIVPELNDAFAKEVARVDTVDALRERLKKDLTEGRQRREERDYELKLLEEVVKRSTFGEIPDILVENEMERLVHELKHDVEQRGMKWPDYLQGMKKDEGTLRSELQPNAVRRVKIALVIRAIIEAERISVSPEEIDEELARIRATLTKREEIEKVAGEEFRDYVRTMVLNRKAIDALKSKQRGSESKTPR